MPDFSTTDITVQSHEDDQRLRHYMPAGKTVVCGARARVYARIERSLEPDKYAALKTPTTTDVRKVECPHCRVFIWRVAAGWSVTTEPATRGLL